MFNKTINLFLITVGLLFCLTEGVFANDIIELNQLVENPEARDGQTVTVTGEAIGEVIERGDHAWVNINDGSNAMGIWMRAEDAQSISVFGDYKHIGDQLQVTGVFNRACVEHGGDMDIHCASITVVKTGYSNEESVSSLKIIWGTILTFLALIIGFIYLKVNRVGG